MPFNDEEKKEIRLLIHEEIDKTLSALLRAAIDEKFDLVFSPTQLSIFRKGLKNIVENAERYKNIADSSR